MRKKVAVILMIVGLLSIAACTTIIWKINASLNHMEIDITKAIIPTLEPEEPQTEKELQVVGEVKREDPEDFYTLLIGLDHRSGADGLNTDTIIVMHVIPQTSTIKVISLLRDLRVESDGGSVHKINSLFANGYEQARIGGQENPDLLSGEKVSLGSWTVPVEYMSSGMVKIREAVEQLLDLEVAHTFLVNFETLVSLVDEVGGIEIDVDRSMEYDDPTDGTRIHLSPGLQMLDGSQVLDFARFRMDNRGEAFYSNDFERSERQQTVISALFDQLSSWKNVTKVFDLLDIVTNSFKTDMKKGTMINLIRKYFNNFNGDSLVSVPFTGYWEYPYVWIDDDKLDALKYEFSSLSK